MSFWIYSKFFITHNNSLLYDINFFSEPVLFSFKYIHFSIFNFKCSIEFFGYIFIILAYIVGVISFLCLDPQFYYKNMRFIFICNFLVLVIYLFTVTTDFLFFFLLYESLLIPSFLFVYYTSTYKRGTQASLYFLI